MFKTKLSIPKLLSYHYRQKKVNMFIFRLNKLLVIVTSSLCYQKLKLSPRISEENLWLSVQLTKVIDCSVTIYVCRTLAKPKISRINILATEGTLTVKHIVNVSRKYGQRNTSLMATFTRLRDLLQFVSINSIDRSEYSALTQKCG